MVQQFFPGDVFRRYFALLRKNALLTIRSPIFLILEVLLLFLVIQQVCFKIYFEGNVENYDRIKQQKAIERPEFVKSYLFDTTDIGEFLKRIDRRNCHLKVAAGSEVKKADFELWKEYMDESIDIKVAGNYENLKKELRSESAYAKANRSIAGLYISELNWDKGHISYELLTSTKSFNSPDFNTGWQKASQLGFRYSLAMLVQYVTDFHFIENFKSDSNGTSIKPAVNQIEIKQVTMAEVRVKNMIVAIMAVFTVRNILHDKAHIKDFLAVMGVSNMVFYFSHLTVLLLKQFLAVLPITLLVILNINKVDIGLCLLSMTLEAFCVLSLVVLITTIWKKSSSASFLTIVLFFLPFNVVTVSPNTGHHSILFLLNFWVAASSFEESLGRAGFQMQSVNLFSSAGPHEYPPIVPFLFLFIDFFLMLFISWAFVFSCSLYDKFKRSRQKNSEEKPAIFENAEEEFDSSVDVDIAISDVNKVYSGGEKAVNGLNLSALKGQVTVLLGHNGAGKTTTFSMICGTTKPSLGSVKIYGELAGTPKAKQNIGYCSQENSLIPDLTVSDHLRLAHGLKCAKTKFNDEVEELLELVGLEERKSTKVKRLSGGQKRKVCLCMALIGGSKVILLDEPTAGMDPESRQDVEMFLETQKGKRTILLTTHYMDEAEILADRVIIMSKGKAVCSGSVDFLKDRFASGYILTILVVKNDDDEVKSGSKKLKTLISNRVAGAVLVEQRGLEFDFKLPAKERKSFSTLFEELEQSKDALGISSFGLSPQTLEHVFLEVGKEGNASEKEISDVQGLRDKLKAVYDDKRIEGFPLKFQQFKAMFNKKLIYSWKHWPTLVFLQILLPVITLLVIALMAQSTGFDIPAQNINFSNFGAGYFVHQSHTDGFESDFRDRFNGFVKSEVEKTGKSEITLKELPRTTLLKNYIYEAPVAFGAIYGVRCVNRVHGGSFGSCEKDQLMSIDPLLANDQNQTEETVDEHVLLIHNSQHLYSLPMALNLFSNTLLKKIIPDGRINITVSFYEEHDQKAKVGTVIGIVLALLMSLVFSNITEPLAEDISVGFMRQQILAGLRPWIYWSVEYTYAFMLYAFQCIFYMASLYYVGLDISNIARVILLSLLLFYMVMPFLSFLSQHINTASGATTTVAAFLGIGLIQGIGMMAKYNEKFVRMFGEKAGPIILQCLFATVLPTVPFAAGIVAVFGIQTMENSNGDPEEGLTQYYSLASVMAVTGTVYNAIFVILQFRKIKKIFCGGGSKREKKVIPEPSEPVVATSPPSSRSSPILDVQDLSKVYSIGKKDKAVLAHISIQVKEKECFGLLGVSGAGKTTAFNIITGQTAATDGSLTVDGKSPEKNLVIGLCPQFDTIHPELTGKEALTLLATSHGYKDADGIADGLIQMVGMEDHAEKKFGKCSGGQKRRLSVAAALLPRQSPFVILDEATAGIDPAARRSVWSVLSAVKDHSAVLMSSHCMQECEALCNRIAILREGQIAATGSSQALKSSLGRFYNFSLTLLPSKEETNSAIDKKVKKEFPGALFQKGSSARIVKWKIPKKKENTWSAMFVRCEKVASSVGASDFSLTQPSLQDIFLLLAKKAEGNFERTSESSKKATKTPKEESKKEE